MAKRIRTEKPDDSRKKGVDLNSSEIPFAVFGNSAHIEMFGNRRFSLDGRFSVQEYSAELIKLKISKGTVQICGRDLLINSVDENGLLVTGYIGTIEFCV